MVEAGFQPQVITQVQPVQMGRLNEQVEKNTNIYWYGPNGHGHMVSAWMDFAHLGDVVVLRETCEVSIKLLDSLPSYMTFSKD